MHREFTQRRQLGFETLENRQMLAGNVTAELVNGDLVVTGDRLSNEIEINDNGNGVNVVGINGTKVNGTESYGQIPGNLKIKMRGGNDSVVLNDIGNGAVGEADGSAGEVLGRIVIAGGAGRDHVTVQGSNDTAPIINGLSIYGGPAGDCVRVISSHVANSAGATNLLVNLGGGHDTFVLEGNPISSTSLPGKSVIDAGAGNDRIRLSRAVSTGNLRVLLRAGADLLAVDDSGVNNMQVYGGYGRDEIGAIDSVFAGNVLINGNRGRDKILARASLFGQDPSDRLQLVGGPEGDWLAAIGGNTFNGTTRILGGRGFDHGYDDGSNTVNGTFTRAGLEGTNAPPNLQNCIGKLLAIDCLH